MDTYPPHSRLIIDLVPDTERPVVHVIWRQQTGFARLQDLGRDVFDLPTSSMDVTELLGGVANWLAAAFSELSRRHSLDAAFEQLAIDDAATEGWPEPATE